MQEHVVTQHVLPKSLRKKLSASLWVSSLARYAQGSPRGSSSLFASGLPLGDEDTQLMLPARLVMEALEQDDYKLRLDEVLAPGQGSDMSSVCRRCSARNVCGDVHFVAASWLTSGSLQAVGGKT